jgi:putative transposase
MSRKGNWWDNAVAESFFKSNKVEYVYQSQFENQAEAKISLFNWIEPRDNRKEDTLH